MTAGHLVPWNVDGFTRAPELNTTSWLRPKPLADVGLITLFATLPLHWVVVSRGTLGGLRWAHIVCALLLLLAVAGYRNELRAILRRHRAFFVLAMLWILVYVLGLYSVGAELTEPLQQLIYVVITLGPAALLHRAVKRSALTTLRICSLAALIGSVAFMVMFTWSSSRNGFNGLAALWSGLASNDRDSVLFSVFRRAIPGSGIAVEEARANQRHEIFVGLVFLVWVSLISRAVLRQRLNRRVGRLSALGIGLASVLVVASLSRAAIVAVALPLVVMLVPTLSRQSSAIRISRHLRLAGACMLAVVVLLSPASSAISQRFTSDTKSYTGRTGLLGDSLSQVTHLPLFGEPREVESLTSPHNFVLDVGQNAGLLAMLAAATLFGWLLLRFGRVVRGYIRHRRSTEFALVGLLFLAIVRMMTTGGGTLALAGWVSLAAYLGLASGLHHATPRAESTNDDWRTEGTDAASVGIR